MQMPENGYEDWGDRAVYWLFSQKFLNWPLPAISRETGESLDKIRTWANGVSRPDRKALQRLRARYGKEGFSSFVFGELCRDELEEKIERLSALIVEIGPYLRSAPSRVVPGDDGQRTDLDGVQTARKVGK